MDGSTGEIRSVSSTVEPFSVECTVTAHQAPGVTFEAIVKARKLRNFYFILLLCFETLKPEEEGNLGRLAFERP